MQCSCAKSNNNLLAKNRKALLLFLILRSADAAVSGSDTGHCSVLAISSALWWKWKWFLSNWMRCKYCVMHIFTWLSSRVKLDDHKLANAVLKLLSCLRRSLNIEVKGCSTIRWRSPPVIQAAPGPVCMTRCCPFVLILGIRMTDLFQ